MAGRRHGETWALTYSATTPHDPTRARQRRDWFDRLTKEQREQIGDDEWSDAGAHVAWAETAIRAGQDDVALVALARARRLASPTSPSNAGIADLVDDLAKRTHRQQPAADLARELLDMTA